MPPTEYTAPEVFTIGVEEGWADPRTNPADVDWQQRRDYTLIPHPVIDGRPVNPWGPTAVHRGRNQLGHWGEQACADALVTLHDQHGHRWALLVERADGLGWALPGGYIDPGETPAAAAIRELEEETGLVLPGATWTTSAPQHVPDPRESDEAWMVTVLATTHLGTFHNSSLPTVIPGDDAVAAAWIRADDYRKLRRMLVIHHNLGRLFPAHTEILRNALG